MNIGVISVNYILYPVGQTPENVNVLGIGKSFDIERTGKKFQVCFQPAACDAVIFQGPQIEFQALDDPDKCCPGDK